MYTKYQKQKGEKQVTADAAPEPEILDFIDNDDFEEINDRPRIILVSRRNSVPK